MRFVNWLARERFNHVDAFGLAFFVSFCSQGWVWSALAAWFIGLLMSLAVRIASIEHEQRHGGQL